MDKLVAQYTRRPHQDEFYSEQEQRALTETLPPISLKFDLPPVDNVSLQFGSPDTFSVYGLDNSCSTPPG